jgi:purine-nucleoside phosphorylase
MITIIKIGTCGTLSEDEVKIMSGVLDMANKVAKDAMHRFRV